MPFKDLDEKQLIALIDKAIKEYSGDGTELEHAIGMFLFGRALGWRVVYLMHDKKTIRKYEALLHIKDIRGYMREETELSRKSVAYSIVKRLGTFWKAVKGEIKGARSAEIHKS